MFKQFPTVFIPHRAWWRSTWGKGRKLNLNDVRDVKGGNDPKPSMLSSWKWSKIQHAQQVDMIQNPRFRTHKENISSFTSVILRKQDACSWGIKNQLDVTCYIYFTYYLLSVNTQPPLYHTDRTVVLQPAIRTPPNIIRSKPQHTTKREQGNRCGNPTTQSRAPEDGHINVRNMLSK